MSIAASIEAPLAMPGSEAAVARLSKPERRAAARRNPFETLPAAAFREPILKLGGLFGGGWLISDPAGIKQVMLDKVANYPKTALERRFFRALFGDGLLSSEGETWRSHRRIMAPAFDPRSVAGYAAAMAETAQAFGDGWARRDNDSRIDISAEMTALTLQIISRTMFSTDASEMADLTGDTLHRGQEEAFNFSLLDLLPIIGPIRMRRREKLMSQIFAPLDGAVNRLIEARKAGAEGPTDLLGRMVAAMDEETGARMTPREVRDQVVTIFIAGHETTASAMTFAWYLLSQHPTEEARLHAELETVLGGRAPTEADLPKLAFTRRVIEETLRIYPSAPGVSNRVALEADTVCGQPLRKGASVLISPWVVHRHRKYWDDPERFDPDRFIPERSADRPRFAYIPFGAGPRICIGAMLAMTEATLILATLAQRFRPRLAPGHLVELQHRVTLRPKDGMPMVLERR